MNYAILGAGFIGKNLALLLEKYISQSDKLILVDINSDNLNFLKENLSHKNITFINDDIRNVKNIFNGIVYNLCAIVGVKSWKENPYKNYEHNKSVTEYIINKCSQENSIKYIYASTSEVYGSSDNITEESDFKILNFYNNPRGLYAFEKLHGEYLSTNLNYINARFFNIIGKYQDIDKGVTPLFINKLCNNEDVYANNDIRCFCDVRDCVNALINLTNKNFTGNINICNENNNISIIEFANLLKKKLNSKSNIIKIDNGDIHSRVGKSLYLDKYYSMKYSLSDTLEWIV